MPQLSPHSLFLLISLFWFFYIVLTLTSSVRMNKIISTTSSHTPKATIIYTFYSGSQYA